MTQRDRRPLPHARFTATCAECDELVFDESSSLSSLLTRLYEALREHAIHKHDWRPPERRV